MAARACTPAFDAAPHVAAPAPCTCAARINHPPPSNTISPVWNASSVSSQAEVHAIIREYLPLGSSDAETTALSESLLGRAAGGGRGGGGSPGGRRKGGLGSPQYAGMAGGGASDVERGAGSEALLPATPARCGALRGTCQEAAWQRAVRHAAGCPLNMQTESAHVRCPGAGLLN